MLDSKKYFALSIAGFDPCGGAGVLADIKTFEANNVYGLGVCSSITFQNDNTFVGLEWLSFENIINQLDPLFDKYVIDVVKIGLIESLDVFAKLISYLKRKNKDIKIIWDPILKASAGFQFHTDVKKDLLNSISENIHLITPNWPEAQNLFGTTDKSFLKNQVACAIYLKGGHASYSSALDCLFDKNTEFHFESAWIEKGEKHGSGCVLSAAIAANIAKKQSLNEACKNAKSYVSLFLASTENLLGFHFDNQSHKSVSMF